MRHNYYVYGEELKVMDELLSTWNRKHMGVVGSCSPLAWLTGYVWKSSSFARYNHAWPSSALIKNHVKYPYNKWGKMMTHPRALQRESISSMKIVLGAYARASSNKHRTMRSLSPRHLEARVTDEMLKKVVPHSVATALANKVFLASSSWMANKSTNTCEVGRWWIGNYMSV